jgi:hypothetical protein
MKRLSLLLLLAIPLFASEDSPLVAAAKRNGRAKMPKKVITNETVKASKGHITTTAVQPPIDLSALPKPPKPAAVTGKAQKPKPESQAVADNKAAEKRERRKARAAAAAEEGMYDVIDDDPAIAERAVQEAEQKPPR